MILVETCSWVCSCFSYATLLDGQIERDFALALPDPTLITSPRPTSFVTVCEAAEGVTRAGLPPSGG